MVLAAILDLLPFAVFIHDREGGLTFANAAARTRGPLRGWPSIDAAVREPGVAHVAICGPDQIASVGFGDGVVTFIARPTAAAPVNIAAAVFSLTPTEQRVVSLLAAGNSARQIANALGMSLHTVHSHLKNIFAKTDTSSQNEVIAIVRGGLALFGYPTIKGCANNSAGLKSPLRVQSKNQESGS